MDLSKEELNALISAVMHYADHHLPDLVRTVPVLGVSGQVDELRGEHLRLLARLRRELANGLRATAVDAEQVSATEGM